MAHMQRCDGRMFTVSDVIEALALRHGAVTLDELKGVVQKYPRTWQIRSLIASARADNSRKASGLGYGPDWRGLPVTLWRHGEKIVKHGNAIKDDISRYVSEGIVASYAIASVAENIRISELIALRLTRLANTMPRERVSDESVAAA